MTRTVSFYSFFAFLAVRAHTLYKQKKMFDIANLMGEDSNEAKWNDNYKIK